MKIIHSLTLLLIICLYIPNTSIAQLPKLRVAIATLFIEGEWGKIDEKKYAPLIDSLNANLKKNPNDTTSLFYKALMLDAFNNFYAKPYQGTKGALENLIDAKNLVEKASSLGMKDLNLKILKAQIYRDLAYRYSGDESWMFDKKKITERRKLFEQYQIMANKCLDELILLDKDNAYDYEKKRQTKKYPID